MAYNGNPYIKLVDTAIAKMVAQCDNCKQSIDLKKPVKPKAGDKKKPVPNPSVVANLETGVDTGETKEFHFCDEECLRQYLNKRASKGK
jgi:hypothetical protein